MGYADRTRRPPRTLTEFEIAKLLAVTGEHKDGFRDHVILSMSLGAGLRIHEIVGLNVGDVSPDGRSVRRRIVLSVFKRSAKDASLQHVFLPDATFYKLQRFLAWKKQRAEALDADAPLFVSREHEVLPNGERRPRRLGTRALRAAFARWQAKAGLDIRRPFHSLRHTACTAVYRATRDVLVVQRFARHASVSTTMVYAQPSDADLLKAVRNLDC